MPAEMLILTLSITFHPTRRQIQFCQCARSRFTILNQILPAEYVDFLFLGIKFSVLASYFQAFSSLVNSTSWNLIAPTPGMLLGRQWCDSQY